MRAASLATGKIGGAGRDDADAGLEFGVGDSGAAPCGAGYRIVIPAAHGFGLECSEDRRFQAGEQEPAARRDGGGQDRLDLGDGFEGAEDRFGNAGAPFALPVDLEAAVTRLAAQECRPRR